MQYSTPIRILFNDAHVNFPSNNQVPQGGLSRFAQMFSAYFEDKTQDIELFSLLFTHNSKDKNIFSRQTEGKHLFFEVVYPRQMLIDTYKKDFAKKEYIKYIKPLLDEVRAVFDQVKPDVVFLNGFSVSHWLMLEIAHQRDIPLCIQHAGVWKKELQISGDYFSSSMRRIFASFEKEIITKASHQIFLNEYSRDTFFSIHNVIVDDDLTKQTSVIPIPVDFNFVKKVSLNPKQVCSVGVVARWDKIKNHAAVMRLASYVKSNSLPLTCNVVTEWGRNTKSVFRDEYVTKVNIVPPMHPAQLKDFYFSQDVILIPSRFDTVPMILIEALMCGKPVIISQKAGGKTSYKNLDLDEFIISPRIGGKHLYKIIQKLIASKNTYLPRYKKLQQKIIKDHNPEKVFEQYYKIFRSITK